VSASGCWIWVGAESSDGYGLTHVDGKEVRAHRLAWTLVRGPIPDGLSVCHRCDVPPCVNPEHLFLGTAQDNTDDMVAKGRQVVQPPKLTPDQARELRTLVAAGWTHRALAERFGISVALVSRVRHGAGAGTQPDRCS